MRPRFLEASRAGRRLLWLAAALVLIAIAGVGEAAPARAQTQGEQIVAIAASQAGKPYCWDGGNQNGATQGTAEPGSGRSCGAGVVGFDCTGLTLYAVYQATGHPLSHDGHQGTEGGQVIQNESELQPGDLVFFGGSFGNFVHAGIYAGGGMFWDADDWGVPVQEHSMAWVEHALPFVGGARYWSGSSSPPTPEMPGTDNGGAQIQSAASGRCLDAPAAQTANGTYLQIWDCNGSAAQHWEYSGGQLKIYGNYGKCLDADANGGGANGTKIQLWTCTGGASQQWVAEPNGSLRSAAYGRCLDVNGGGTANGTQLQLWDCHGGANQRWSGIPAPNGGGPVRGFASGLCLDVPGASISPGARLQLWDCHGGANQQWVMEGSQLRVFGGECLDALNGGTENGTPIQAWPCNGGGAQQWEWRPDGTIRLKAGGRCLDVQGAGTANGATLQLYDCNGGAWQKWGRPPRTATAAAALAGAAGGSSARRPVAGRCNVPDLKKLTLKQARRGLTAAGCMLGKVKRHGRARRRRGKVTHQTAAPARQFPAGHRVGLTLS